MKALSVRRRDTGDYRRKTAGQALVEIALVLPLFLILVMTLFDFGRVIFVQNAITNDARQAVREAVVNASYTDTKYNAIRAVAEQKPLLVALGNSDVKGAPSLTCPVHSDNVDASTCFYAGAATGDGKPQAGGRVEVNITVSVPIITPILSTVLGGSFTLTARSVGFVQCSGC